MLTDLYWKKNSKDYGIVLGIYWQKADHADRLVLEWKQDVQIQVPNQALITYKEAIMTDL